MSELIVTAKTVDQAIDKACAQLGLSRDEVSVEVLEMPTRRLFSSTPAKVKVTYGSEEEAPAAAEQQPEPAAEKPAPQEEKKAQPDASAKTSPAAPAAEKAEEKPAEEPAAGEKVDATVAYFKAVAAQMGVEDFTVEPVRVNGAVILRVDGPNVGALIGRRGETMEALSYLMGLAGNRAGGDYEKFGLDVAGYRGKREKDLDALARRVGAKVQKTGRSHMFEPMNPYERRIIHSAISEMEELSSESTGEGADRRVVVRSTGPNALPDKPRAPRGDRYGRGGSGKGGPRKGGRDRDRGPRREPRERPPRPQPTGDAPVVPERAPSSLDEGFDLPLYGKIEL